MAENWQQKVVAYLGADAVAATVGSLVSVTDVLRVNTDVTWANRPLKSFWNNDALQSVITPGGGLMKIKSQASLDLFAGRYAPGEIVSGLIRSDAGEGDKITLFLAAVSDAWAHAAEVDLQARAISTGPAGQYEARLLLDGFNATVSTGIDLIANTVSGGRISVVGVPGQTTAYMFRLRTDTDGDLVVLHPLVADGVSAVAATFDTSFTLADPAALLLAIKNNGVTSMTVTAAAALRVGLGSASLPAWSFVGDPNTGIYGSGGDVLNISSGGVNTVSFLPASLVSVIQAQFDDGSAASPIYSFLNDADCGLFRSGANSIGISTAGTARFTWGALAVTIADAYNFIFNTTTGTKFGTVTTQKLGFWNATPVVRPTNVTNPTGGATVDTQARTAIDDILSRLESIGLFAP